MALNLPRNEPKAGAPEWMCTFADLMSLLLTFFVLLLSFSTVEIVKFKSAADSIKDAFGVQVEINPTESSPLGARPIPRPVQSEGQRLLDYSENMMVVKLRSLIEKSSMTGSANVEVEDRGVILRLDGDALFESGRADLKEGALGLLDELVQMASKAPGQIEVEGHTDDLPIASSRFPSNWELSAARAGSAVRYLTGRGLPAARLKAIGYADTRPLVPNSSAENRAKNRRVELLFIGSRTASREYVPRRRDATPLANPQGPSSPEESGT